jgi:DNA-binding IclR family transcriptional regulator
MSLACTATGRLFAAYLPLKVVEKLIIATWRARSPHATPRVVHHFC